MKRKPTSKTLRFEVFKRDSFTCRYCGARPPDVVLEVDHVVPVASDGLTVIDNLVTSCAPCNRGKAARPLGAVSPPVDSDLLIESGLLSVSSKVEGGYLPRHSGRAFAYFRATVRNLVAESGGDE